MKNSIRYIKFKRFLADVNKFFRKLATTFYSIIFMLMMLCVFIIVGYAIIILFDIKDFSNANNLLEGSIFSLILTGIAIILGTSIFIPRYVIEQKVDEELEKKSDDIRNKLEETHGSHISNIDAQLSRMISYLLEQNATLNSKIDKSKTGESISIYLWASGWSSRSFKNYLRISDKDDVLGESTGHKNYNDLIKIIIGIVKRTENMVLNFLEEKHLEIESQSENPSRSLNFESIKQFFIDNKLEEDWDALHKRSVKEILDNEYKFDFGDYDYDLKSPANKFINASASVGYVSLLTLVYQFKDKPKEYVKVEELAESIILKSSFKEDYRYQELVKDVFKGAESELKVGINIDSLKELKRLSELSTKDHH